MLLLEHRRGPPWWQEADEHAVAVDDCGASAAGASEPLRSLLLVDPGADDDRGHYELRDGLFRACGKQTLDGHEADEAIAVADREVGGARERAAEQGLADVTRATRRVCARNVCLGGDGGHADRRRRMSFAVSTSTAGSSERARTIPSSGGVSDTVSKICCSGRR